MTVDYALLEQQVRTLLGEERDFIANAANFAALLYHELPEVNWCGFYLAPSADDDLLLGPFSGRPACVRLPAGRGVCGAAATRGATVVVDDVEAFADHIACDIASRSEIVVPLTIDGSFAGVFDCDSPKPARFSDDDRVGIERLVRAFSESVHPPPTSGR